MKWCKGLDKPDKDMCDCTTITDSVDDINEIKNGKEEKVEFCAMHLTCCKRDHKEKNTSFDTSGRKHCMP